MLERAVERHGEIGLAAGQLVDPIDVGHRGARRHLLLIADRHRRAVGGRTDGCPPPRHGRRSGLRTAGRSMSRAASARRASSSAGSTSDGMPSGVRTMNWIRASTDSETWTCNSTSVPPSAFWRIVLEAAPELGVVALARHVDQARDEPGERIAAEEQPDLLPLLQVQDLLGDPEQLLLVGLEQLVARIGVEDVDQRLAGVAGRRQVRARDHLAPPCGGAAGSGPGCDCRRPR